eukprot:CAMPEP_0172736544 /NCGR_PEP_ID=MMETSP1074-20121228/115353_1 /TAXON_ID=2916 /ORGANISM="Ceratium fusus, Strain PA161109" /LENGTH=44 /DNA_ID= /DNA_START= /DNA_END= /DNA_ORIENTATION=
MRDQFTSNGSGATRQQQPQQEQQQHQQQNPLLFDRGGLEDPELQ